MKTSTLSALLFLVLGTILLSGCWGSLVVSSAKIAKSQDTQNKSKKLERKNPVVTGDSANYAHYYIYRSGSFRGSALSTLIYDNNEYITIAKVQTFEKIDFVTPGKHVFTSKIDAKHSITFNLDSGKTYLIQVMPNNSIKEKVMLIMNHDMIKKELEKGKFFYEKFTESGLKVEDFSY